MKEEHKILYQESKKRIMKMARDRLDKINNNSSLSSEKKW